MLATGATERQHVMALIAKLPLLVQAKPLAPTGLAMVLGIGQPSCVLAISLEARASVKDPGTRTVYNVQETSLME